MRRKMTQFAIICLASLLLVACEKLAGPSPKQVLSDYLDASLKGRYKEAYSYISSEDKAIKDLQSYLNDNNSDNPLAEAIASKVLYKINNIKESQEKATADVEVTLPDYGSIFVDAMGAAFKSAFGGGDEKEVEKMLAKKFENGEVPMTTKEETFHLVKEDGDWKVFLDWKTEKIKNERQAKIQQFLAEAEELKETKKLHGAIEKYEQILELDSEMVDAKKGLEETKKEIESLEEKQAYIKNIELYDLRAQNYTTYLDEKVPGVEFKLRNKGDRTLKEIEVSVYFKDASGTIIAEEDYHPVLVTKYSFGSDNKPLKPNYVWQMDRGKFYKANSVPSEWEEGSVSARITNIEFE